MKSDVVDVIVDVFEVFEVVFEGDVGCAGVGFAEEMGGGFEEGGEGGPERVIHVEC